MELRLPKSFSGPSRLRPRPQKRPAAFKLREYTFGETIGEGTFGKVKSAIHKVTKKKVAIKIIDKKRIVKSADRVRVLTEIKILQRLDHPHIIRLHEVADSKRYIFLITEYISCGELFDYIVKHGRLLEWQACRFFHQLIDAVEYIHKKGIVHRDLKPENILLDDKLNIKICDFGLGNIDKNGGMFKTACGSPCYVAPEMISGMEEFIFAENKTKTLKYRFDLKNASLKGGYYEGSGVDIWACGVILYAMLCGFLPFEDSGNLAELYDLIFEANYEIPPFLSRGAQSLIGKILVVDPTRRYVVQQIRRHRWFRLIPDIKGDRKVDHDVDAKIASAVIEDISSLYSSNQPLRSPKRITPAEKDHKRTGSARTRTKKNGKDSGTFNWATSPPATEKTSPKSSSPSAKPENVDNNHHHHNQIPHYQQRKSHLNPKKQAAAGRFDFYGMRMALPDSKQAQTVESGNAKIVSKGKSANTKKQRESRPRS